MAKKALVSTIEPDGKDNSGYRVLDVIESNNTFEVHSNLQWKDCPDTIEMDKYWFDSISNTFKKLPHAVDAITTVGELSTDVDGNPTEKYEWNWDAESWSKIPI